jgi:HAE1 family hydrophobic/amphiphilic exporter-1
MTFLARLSLANRSLIGLLTIVFIAVGAAILTGLRQQLLPTFEPPTAVIITSYPGASPDVVDAQVTEPIEAGIRGISGLNTFTSESGDSAASIRVQFKFGTDMDRAVQNLQEIINGLRDRLPKTAAPKVATGGLDQIPVVTLATSSTEAQQQVLDRLNTSTVPELKKIAGVREVTVAGAPTEKVAVTVDYTKLASAGVQPAALIAALQQVGKTTPIGTVGDSQRTISVEVGGQLNSIEALRDINLISAAKKDGTDPVPLGSVASVEKVTAEQTSITRTNGKPSLSLSVMSKSDADTVAISKTVRDKLPALNRALGTELVNVFDAGPPVEEAMKGMTKEGLLGLGFALLVIVLFLRSARSTLVVGMSIPLSLLLALILLGNGDYSLNLITLSGLTIAVGRVVDDSIVVLENIKRHLGYGEEKKTAVLGAVREVSGAVTSSTLTTVAVFLPIVFVGGITGQILGPFASTVSVALIASLLVSLTVVPVLAYWFLKPGDKVTKSIAQTRVDREQRSWLQKIYVPMIRFAVRHKITTLLIALIIFAGTAALSGKLKTNFLDNNGDSVTITQTMPPGTNLQVRDAAAKRIEDLISSFPGIKSYQVTIGSDGDFNTAATDQTSFQMTLRDAKTQKATQEQLRNRINSLKDVGEVKFAAQSNGVSSEEVSVVVKAPNDEALRTAAEQVRRTVTETPGLSQVTTDLAKNMQRLQITLNASAAAMGMTQDTVSQLTSEAMGGSPVTEVTIGGKQLELVLRSRTSTKDLAALRAMPIASEQQTSTLGKIAQLRMVEGPVKINRTGGERSVTVSAKPEGKDLGAVTGQLTDKLKALNLSGGATYTLGGASADESSAFRDLGIALGAAVLLVFLVMVATFRSIAQAIVLLISIPFAATGALGMLLATDTPLGLPAMIGMLMLVGIVVTNAIVLIDLVNQYRDKGMTISDAVIEGGRRRLRPILMTAAATIFALIPMALGFGGDNPFIGKPLGLVVIGGLVSSTVLTLVVVPTLYTIVERVKERSRRKRNKPPIRSRPAAASDWSRQRARHQMPSSQPIAWPTRDVP